MPEQKSNIHLIKQKTDFMLKPAISTVYGAIKQDFKVVVFFCLFLKCSWVLMVCLRSRVLDFSTLG